MLRPPTEAFGLPPEAYSDHQFYLDEQQSVFERSWVCVGTVHDVLPGAAMVRSVGSRSVIVVNDAGAYRGFLNACRHRGTELLDGDRHDLTAIRCPYHRWAYRLDGSLLAAPRMRELPRTDRGVDLDLSLVTVRVEVWGVLVFVCLDDRTAPLAQWLGDLPQRMAGYQFSSEHWRHIDERQVTIAANWKLISENYQEYYHLPWVHPELAKVSRVDDHYRYQGPGMYCGQTTTPVSRDSRDDWLVLPPAWWLDQSDSVSGRFVAIFPNVLLSVLPNHIWLMRLDPQSPGVTHEICTLLVPETSAPSTEPGPPEATGARNALDKTVAFWLDVNGEDIDIVERGQRGVTGGAVPGGPLVPRYEEPLNRFHRMLYSTLTLGSLADLAVPAGDRVGEAADRFGAGENPQPPSIELSSDDQTGIDLP